MVVEVKKVWNGTRVTRKADHTRRGVIQMENKQQAIEARNELVREWDEAKKHLRQIREDQFNGIGSGMNAEDWKEWDSVDAFYNEAVGKIDHVIFMNGWMA